MKTDVHFAFLHGGGQGGWVWRNTIAALSLQTNGRYGRSLALDVPGCGTKRGRDTTGMGPDEITAELLSELVDAGMENVVLVGHSQAGNIMPRLAELRPNLFRRLVYVSCSSPLPGQTVLQMMGSGAHGSNEDEVGWPKDSIGGDARERNRRIFCNDMSEAEASTFLAQLGNDMWPKLSYAATEWRYDHLADVPSTYVICLRDSVLPVNWQEKFAGRFRVDRTVRIDAGHQAMNTRPQALAEILLHEAS